MAKGLTIADKEYIKRNSTLPLKSLASATDKTQAAIKLFLATLEPPEVREKTALQKQIMMSKTGFGIALPKGATELADDLKKSHQSSKPKNRADIVFKPHG
jgi:hypothetical protein